MRESLLNKLNEQVLSLQVLKKFRLIFGAVRQHFREVEQTCGISGSQVWILREISRKNGIGVSELAGLLSIHQSTCSQLVEKLVARGFIVKERCREDQRRVGLGLTETAVAILSTAPGPVEGLLPDALRVLSDESLLALDASLGQLIDQLAVHDDTHANNPLADL